MLCTICSLYSGATQINTLRILRTIFTTTPAVAAHEIHIRQCTNILYDTYLNKWVKNKNINFIIGMSTYNVIINIQWRMRGFSFRRRPIMYFIFGRKGRRKKSITKKITLIL
jgi:hypothetical protein